MKDKISSILFLLYQDFINLVNIKIIGFKDIKVRELNKHGIITIENYLSPEKCNLIASKLQGLKDKYNTTTQITESSHIHFRNEHDPNATDYGMVDIHHVDDLIPEIKEINDDRVVEIIQGLSKQRIIKFRRNSYINNSVKNTRGFHMDNVQPVIYKAFIYLTDVLEEKHGPYTFVKGTHRFSFYCYYNLFRNLFIKKNLCSDTPIYNKKKEISAYGKKGTLVLSHQNAIHRGLPQGEGETRIATVFNYFIKSKMTYLNKTSKETLKGLL